MGKRRRPMLGPWLISAVFLLIGLISVGVASYGAVKTGSLLAKGEEARGA